MKIGSMKRNKNPDLYQINEEKLINTTDLCIFITMKKTMNILMGAILNIINWDETFIICELWHLIEKVCN